MASPSPEFCIPTKRLYISHFEPDSPEHSVFLARLWNIDDFIQSCGRTSVSTPEKAAEFIQNRVHAGYMRIPYAILADSKPIGTVSLMKGDPPHGYTVPDIGYAILPEENKNGYAMEAALGLLEYARRELGVSAVFGFSGKDDMRSRWVLEKIGMEFRGEKKLRVFGGRESAVYAMAGMDALKLYGIED